MLNVTAMVHSPQLSKQRMKTHCNGEATHCDGNDAADTKKQAKLLSCDTSSRIAGTFSIHFARTEMI